VRCGEALGLGLYGLDILETAEGPKVVDLNAFPSYRGVAGIAPFVADYISGYASGEIRLSPLGIGSLEEIKPNLVLSSSENLWPHSPYKNPS
jgi:Inositol 1,3,4-trisphosphate 5/6-kinase ATP-grasp domain